MNSRPDTRSDRDTGGARCGGPAPGRGWTPALLRPLALVAASLTLAAAGQTPPGGAQAPSAAAPLAASAASVPAAPNCMRVSEDNSSCAPGLQLLFKTVVLPAGREGATYAPRRLVSGGRPPYSYAVTEGQWPAGLRLSGAGELLGVPTSAGLSRFTVRISDSSSPALTARQAYTLRVAAPPRQRDADASGAQAVTALKPEDARKLVNTSDAGTISSWVLRREVLEAMLAPPVEAPPEAEAAASAPPASPAPSAPPAPTVAVAHPEQVLDMLTPMLDIEYATRVLFERALEARRCAYLTRLVAAAENKPESEISLVCPPAAEPPAAAAAAVAPEAAASAPIPLPKIHAELLPDPLKTALATQAQQRHPIAEAQAMHWSDDGCGCVAVTASERTYGILPFWQTREAKAEPLQFRFSLFSRIGYLGAQLTDDGNYLVPGPADANKFDFVRTAQRFGTRVDLVLQRSDWKGLLNRTDLDKFIARATREAMLLVDTPMTDLSTRIKHLTMPFWDEPTHAFDGLTLFFDYPTTDKAEAARFKDFYAMFVRSLIGAMQQSGRRYALNILVPYTEIGSEGAYSFKQLNGYLDLVRPPSADAKAAGAGAVSGPLARLPAAASAATAASAAAAARPPSQVTISLLVMLSEPTSATKKKLRALVDETKAFEGHERVDFLEATVPIVFHSGGDPLAVATSLDLERLDLDLAYFSWVYGGSGFWPLPLSNEGNGPGINQKYEHNYMDGGTSPLGLCERVCPNRSWVRLFFMTLLLTGGAGLGLYLWVCKVQALGRRYILFLWIDGIATLLVGFVLYSCDPSLAALRAGKLLLASLLLVAVALGMYFSLKPRVTPP